MCTIEQSLVNANHILWRLWSIVEVNIIEPARSVTGVVCCSPNGLGSPLVDCWQWWVAHTWLIKICKGLIKIPGYGFPLSRIRIPVTHVWERGQGRIPFSLLDFLFSFLEFRGTWRRRGRDDLVWHKSVFVLLFIMEHEAEVWIVMEGGIRRRWLTLTFYRERELWQL